MEHNEDIEKDNFDWFLEAIDMMAGCDDYHQYLMLKSAAKSFFTNTEAKDDSEDLHNRS